MPKVTKEERFKEKNKHAIAKEHWRANDAFLFGPPTSISDDAAKEALRLLIQACKKDIDKKLFKEELKSVEAAYWRGRSEHDKPKRDWYIKHYCDLKKAIELAKEKLSSVKGMAREALENRISSSLRNERVSSIRGFQDALDSLSIVCTRLIDEFETSDESPIFRSAKAGARDNAHIEYSARELVKVWKRLTRKRFVLNFENAKNKEESVEFVPLCVQFVFVLLKDFDEGMTIHRVKHALLPKRKYLVQK